MGIMVEDFTKVLERYEKSDVILMDNDLKELNKIYNENKPVFYLEEIEEK